MLASVAVLHEICFASMDLFHLAMAHADSLHFCVVCVALYCVSVGAARSTIGMLLCCGAQGSLLALNGHQSNSG